MRPPRELVYRELADCQVGYGGYTEEDVTKTADVLLFGSNTHRRWLKGWGCSMRTTYPLSPANL